MRRLIGAVVLALATVLALPSTAAAKSLRIVAVEVGAHLEPDGRMRVIEAITYDFEGPFTSASRTIPPGPYEISAVEVRDEAGAELPAAGAPHELTWSFRAADQRRTFTVAYTVSNFLRVGSDVADLRWNWLGPGHPGVGVMAAELVVPAVATGEPVLGAWGHGPLQGRVEVEGNRILWSAEEVPAGTPLEGRVAIPASTLTAGAGPTAILPAIEADEAARQAEAGRRRAAPRELKLDPERIAELNRWFAVVPIMGWILFLLLWREWGREPQIRNEPGQYVRPPPDDPPAIAAALVMGGVVDSQAAVATIVDLARRGALEIVGSRTGPEGWVLKRRGRPSGLLAFEAHLLDRLFREGDTVTGEEIAGWARSNPGATSRWWAGFCTLVEDEMRRRHYIEAGPSLPLVVNMTVVMGVLVASVVALTAGALVGAVGVLSAGLQMAATLTLGRRTPAGAQRLVEWRAFRRFLLDFSNLREAPQLEAALWERYLVYGVALGLAPEVAKGIAVKLPADAQAGFAPWCQTASLGGLHRFGVHAGAAGRLLTPGSGSYPLVG